ncbi:OTU domain-containing protein 5-A [Hypsibius exemplaris]|uniref:ubiquitinyl hydrolase 1 n=1 Tax=Hypsibius exemplaris TaxID=2072580 RepID=A0A1W0X9X2_HYPEX|nr:OTU domain-containing protein 5-A [Hypsibius exemplaris]
MTILPKTKGGGAKERKEQAAAAAASTTSSTNSRANSLGPPSPLDANQLQNITPYGLLTENEASLQGHGGMDGGSNRQSHVAGPSKTSVFHRNKKQRLYDETGDGGSGMDAGGSSSSAPRQFNRDGHNSDDEHGDDRDLAAEELAQKEVNFARLLKEKRGFVIKNMKEDGACLFRAVADQVLGDEEMHDMVRQQCLDYMERNEDYFSQYITEDFAQYIDRKRTLTAHGNHVEIQAMSEVYNRRIEVYEYDIDAINVFQGAHPQENAPIRVSYHQKTHYNSVIDPFAATIGVGLGLPNFHPGLAEERLMNQAMGQSEQEAGLIEKQMLEDKILETDWEAANEAIERQIAQESYLEWLKMSEKQNRRHDDSAPSTSASKEQQSPKRNEPNSPSRSDAMNQRHIIDELNHLPPALFGLNDWDEEDGDMLARVLATSQAEYLESLKPKDRSH